MQDQIMLSMSHTLYILELLLLLFSFETFAALAGRIFSNSVLRTFLSVSPYPLGLSTVWIDF